MKYGQQSRKLVRDKGQLSKRRKFRQVAIENKSICREQAWNHPPTWSEVTAGRIAPPSIATGQTKPTVYFSQEDTVSAILTAHDKGFKNKGIVALNFANGKTVGGGYKNGASAQEEDLCRAIPELYPSLCGAKAKGLYPFGPSAFSKKPIIFGKRRWRLLYSTVLRTRNLKVQRDSRFKLLPKHKHRLVSLVHAAAPNINFAKDEVNEGLLKAMIRGMLAPSPDDPRSVLILGAWGCGAFGGDPKLMSRLFKECIKELSLPGGGPCFSHIWFAIPSGRNYEVFFDTFSNFRPQFLH